LLIIAITEAHAQTFFIV